MKLHIHETMSHLREHCAAVLEQGSTIRQRGHAYDEVTVRGAEIRHITVPISRQGAQRMHGICSSKITDCPDRHWKMHEVAVDAHME